MKSSFDFKKIIGVAFILLGISFNRLVLELFLSPYAIIQLNSRVPLWIMSFSCIAFGLFVYLIKKENFTTEKIGKTYQYVSVTFLTTLLIFIFANVLVQVFYMVKDVGAYKSQIFLSYRKSLEDLYPSLNKKDIYKLLYDTWSRPYVYEPYTQFKERAYKSQFINVSENGFRLVKNQGPWPLQKNNLNVFLFGGSTAFNYGVKDDETIASHLQDYLGKKFKKKIFIYNFGRGNYFSSQERILYEELLTEGHVPDIAIFLDGLNDFYYIDNEPLFTKQFKDFLEGKGAFLTGLPIYRVFELIKGKKEQKFHRREIKEVKYDDENAIKKAIHRYVRNKKAVETVSNSFNVKPLFIWQPVPTYKYDLNYHILGGVGFGRFMYSKYGYVSMEKFFKKKNLGNNFLWLADMQEGLKKSLYIDIDHYSPEMSKEIAKRIYNYLVSNVEYARRMNEQALNNQRVLGFSEN